MRFVSVVLLLLALSYHGGLVDAFLSQGSLPGITHRRHEKLPSTGQSDDRRLLHPSPTIVSAASVSSSTSSSLANAFSQVVHSRYSNSKYSPTPIPASVLNDILRLTQRAPSSFNIQPYTMVVARSLQSRQRLAKAMLGANGGKVLSAPISIIFAADLESSRLMPKVVAALRKATSYPEAFIEKVPFFATLFSSGYRLWPIRWLLWLVKRMAFSLVGLFQAVPRPELPEAWAAKNTMLAAMSLMLAATAHGLTSCPLEGFDAVRVRRALGIPRRYAIPVVVTVGYAAAEEEEQQQQRMTERYPLSEVAFEDEYGTPWPAAGV